MNDKRLVWLDLETSGLNPKTEGIIAIGVIVTDVYLNKLAEFEEYVNNGSKWTMDPIVREMHTKSGTLEKCEKSQFDLRRIADITHEFIRHHGGDKPYLAGSSIHFDQAFLRESMPKVLQLCHRRMLDVSVFKVLGDIWGLEGWVNPTNREPAHTPLADLEASMEGLRFYCRNAGTLKQVFGGLND